MQLFRGKTALVTGASSGIGEEIARQLAAVGCNLVLVARREQRLQSLRDQLLKQGIQVDVIAADLLQPNAANELFERTQALGLKIDVLINNAGFGSHGDFLEVGLESHQAMIQLMVTVVTELSHLYGEAMKARGNGYILNVASIAGFMPVPSFSTYGAAKAFVLSFSQALSAELKPHGVNVTALCPGGTLTEFMDVSGQNITGWRSQAMMTSESVAKAGLRGLARGCATVVPGWLYKISMASLRLIPRRTQGTFAQAAMR